MADIAKRAGVSLSTVSYVLSGKRPISEATKRRVFVAIDDLGFHPNAVGRALASRRSRTIALLYPSAAHGLAEMPLEFVISAVEAAGRHGYALVLSTSPHEDDAMLGMIEQGFVDGLILMEIKLHDPRVELLRARRCPFTMIGHCEDNSGVSFVDLDFAHAIRTAVTHLDALGHHRIAFIGRETALANAGYGPMVRSLEGFHQALAERGLDGIECPCEPAPQAGYNATRDLLAARPPVDALVAINSEAIGGIMRAAFDAGLRIPDDLSIVAITSPRIAELVTPALTTLDFPTVEMGRMGAELLIRQLEGGDEPPTHCLLQAKLTVRQSTGCHGS